VPWGARLGPLAAHRGVEDQLATGAAPRRARVGLTDRDRVVLAFVAEHRIVVRAHIRALLAVGEGAARARLRALANAGFMTRGRSPDGHQECYAIRPRGLAALAATMAPTRLDYRGFEHDVGIAWIWLAARQGLWGQAREVVSERRMRSHDRSEGGRDAPFAVRLGGVGPGGAQRMHYPDVLLVRGDGRRVAFELELSGKSRVRRERILAGYGADPRIDAVVYLVDNPQVGRAIRATARKLGISDLVHVQRVQRREPAAQAQAGRQRAASRSRSAPAPGAYPHTQRAGSRSRSARPADASR